MTANDSVLIVDDVPTIRTTLKAIFARRGFEIAGEAANGFQAIEKFVELRPSLVVLDVAMPEMNGLEALKRIREIDGDARVVMCSGQGKRAIVLEALRLGAKDFVVKPFEADRIIEAIGKAA